MITRTVPAAEAAMLDRAFQAISAARRAARLKFGSGAPGVGWLACPACHRGRLEYRVGPHGRMDGQCSTANCVRWSGQ